MTKAPAPGRTGAFVMPVPRALIRTIGGWAFLVAAAVLLWPATWGGLTGLTVVSGHSMEPTYHTGDLVITWRQSSYEVGDIVSYTVPADQPGAGGHVIHRIDTVDVENGVTTYTTLGDNNPAPDQWALQASDITGTAVLHVPGVGRWIGPAVLPYVAAIAIGAIVCVLLWRDDDDEDENENDDTDTDTDTEDATTRFPRHRLEIAA